MRSSRSTTACRISMGLLRGAKRTVQRHRPGLSHAQARHPRLRRKLVAHQRVGRQVSLDLVREIARLDRQLQRRAFDLALHLDRRRQCWPFARAIRIRPAGPADRSPMRVFLSTSKSPRFAKTGLSTAAQPAGGKFFPGKFAQVDAAVQIGDAVLAADRSCWRPSRSFCLAGECSSRPALRRRLRSRIEA